MSNKKINTNKIRVGIVGAGLMGKWHARAAEKAGGEIVGVADIHEAQAVGIATNYPQARGFSDVREMLKQESFDVLHICTPTATHQTIAELAITAGVNLFIEKPMTQTAAETVCLYELAANHNVRLCPAHQFAFQQGVEKAKKMLPRIGQTIHLQANICSAGADGLGIERLDTVGGEILPHPLSLFQTFLNDLLPEDGWEVFRPRHGEFRIFGQAGETSLSIFVSMNARPTTNSFQIFGTDGTIHLDLFHGFAVGESGKVSKAGKILRPFDSAVKNFSAATMNLTQRAFRSETAYPGLQRLVNSFYKSLREDGEPPITPEQAINVARVRDFVLYRAMTNQLIKD